MKLEEKYEEFLKEIFGKSFQEIMDSSEEEKAKISSEIMFHIQNDDENHEYSLMANHILIQWGKYDTDQEVSMDDGFMNRYFEGYRDFPACNHVQGIGPENIGYTNGITWDGLPFEAELYIYGEPGSELKELDIIFPDIYVEEDDVEEDVSDCEDVADENYAEGYTPDDDGAKDNVTGFSYEVNVRDFSVLPIGMVERGQEENLKMLQWYSNYVEEMGLVNFTGNMRNCSVFYYTDINGNDLVQVRIGLIMNGIEEATTDLTFRDFPYRVKNSKKSSFKVVK